MKTSTIYWPLNMYQPLGNGFKIHEFDANKNPMHICINSTRIKYLLYIRQCSKNLEIFQWQKQTKISALIELTFHLCGKGGKQLCLFCYKHPYFEDEVNNVQKIKELSKEDIDNKWQMWGFKSGALAPKPMFIISHRFRSHCLHSWNWASMGPSTWSLN